MNGTDKSSWTSPDDSLTSSSSLPVRYGSMMSASCAEPSSRVKHDSRNQSSTIGESVPLIAADKTTVPGLLPVRHQLAIHVFLGMLIACCMRQNVSVAMVAMVNSSYVEPALYDNDSLSNIETCDVNFQPTDDNKVGGIFNWNTHTQELLLSGFFYGYIFTQIPGGWLADRFGMKWVFAMGMLLSSVCTLLRPLAAFGGAGWYFLVQIVSGVGEGALFPAMFAVWSKWAHPLERAMFAMIGFTGFATGSVLGNALTGYLIELDIAGGWPFAFYLYGAIGCCWVVTWCFLAYSSPQQHPWISDEERQYLQDGLKTRDRTSSYSIPWGPMLLSPALWTVTVCNLSVTMCLFTVMLNLPLYYSSGMKVSIEKAGVYSAIPFIFHLIMLTFAGRFSDWLIQKGFFSKLTTRKIMSALGFGSAAVFFLMTGFAKCDVTQSIIYVTISASGIGVAVTGHLVALLDVSGPYAGSAMGLVNTIGSLGGIVAPYFVAVLTEIQSDITGWQEVMWIFSGLCVVGGVVFVVFGTVSLQPWAVPAEPRNDDVDGNQGECK